MSDPTQDVRVATENLLADFLREICEVTAVQQRSEEQLKAKREAAAEQSRRADPEKERSQDLSAPVTERGAFLPDNEHVLVDESPLASPDEKQDGRDAGRKYSCVARIASIDLYSRLGPWSGCQDRLRCYSRDSHPTA